MTQAYTLVTYVLRLSCVARAYCYRCQAPVGTRYDLSCAVLASLHPISDMERKRKSKSSTRTTETGVREASTSTESAAKREKTDGPHIIQCHEVTAASFRIRNGVKETPLKVACKIYLTIIIILFHWS